MLKKVFLVLGILLISPRALADQITLKNGDRLSGSIVKADDKKLVIKTDHSGEIATSRDAIDQIKSDQPLYLSLSDGQTIVGTVTTVGDNVEVQTRDTNKVTVARKSIGAIRSQAEQDAYIKEVERYRDPGILDLWSGNVDLGLALTRGNSETTNFAMAANAVRATKRDKTSVYFTSLYAQNKTNGISETTANAIRGGARYELNITDRTVVFGFGDLEHDEFQKLDLRLVLGGGLGHYLVKSERTQFQVFGGGNLNKEYFSDDTRRTSGELLAGEDLATKLNDRVSFLERFVLYPNLSEGGEFRMAFDSSLVTKVNRWLDWHLTVSDRYLSNPAFGVKKNDALLTTGVRLSFKR
jgi:putative salt-induced outer membrane protein YdiY